MNGYNDIDVRLLNNFQHAFPLVRRPFRNIGSKVGRDEDEVIDRFGRLAEDGALSRIGPVFSPGSIGVSTLAALAVPAQRVQEVADWLNAFPEINHNYEREHGYNLWFVATAPDQDWLDGVLYRIADHLGYPMLVLPMLERYHIDLGFDLNGSDRHAANTARTPRQGARVQISDTQAAVVAALQSGIRLEREPFAAVGEAARMKEDDVIDQIVLWRIRGVIKRFGVVVRHHELGYRENAMAVWDVPDELVSEIGRTVARKEGVTLCYRRRRQLPDWPYNLFCMVHGTDRAVVEEQIARFAANTGLTAFPNQTLFSRRRLKQCGAQYVHATQAFAAERA